MRGFERFCVRWQYVASVWQYVALYKSNMIELQVDKSKKYYLCTVFFKTVNICIRLYD